MYLIYQVLFPISKLFDFFLNVFSSSSSQPLASAFDASFQVSAPDDGNAKLYVDTNVISKKKYHTGICLFPSYIVHMRLKRLFYSSTILKHENRLRLTKHYSFQIGRCIWVRCTFWIEYFYINLIVDICFEFWFTFIALIGCYTLCIQYSAFGTVAKILEIWTQCECTYCSENCKCVMVYGIHGMRIFQLFLMSK